MRSQKPKMKHKIITIILISLQISKYSQFQTGQKFLTYDFDPQNFFKQVHKLKTGQKKFFYSIGPSRNCPTFIFFWLVKLSKWYLEKVFSQVCFPSFSTRNLFIFWIESFKFDYKILSIFWAYCLKCALPHENADLNMCLNFHIFT